MVEGYFQGDSGLSIALEGQDLPRTYLAHHELESVIIIVVDVIIVVSGVQGCAEHVLLQS